MMMMLMMIMMMIMMMSLESPSVVAQAEADRVGWSFVVVSSPLPPPVTCMYVCMYVCMFRPSVDGGPPVKGVLRLTALYFFAGIAFIKYKLSLPHSLPPPSSLSLPPSFIHMRPFITVLYSTRARARVVLCWLV